MLCYVCGLLRWGVLGRERPEQKHQGIVDQCFQTVQQTASFNIHHIINITC